MINGYEKNAEDLKVAAKKGRSYMELVPSHIEHSVRAIFHGEADNRKVLYGYDGVPPSAAVNGICTRDWSASVPGASILSAPFRSCDALEMEGKEGLRCI